MPKIKHSKKPRIKVKTIKIKGEGLVQVLDGVQKRIEDLSHNEMMNGAQVRLLATRDREKYKKLWIEYEVLLKKYVEIESRSLRIRTPKGGSLWRSEVMSFV